MLRAVAARKSDALGANTSPKTLTPDAAVNKALRRITALLKAQADPKTCAWFTAYMKERERFIGVKTPIVEATLRGVLGEIPQQTQQGLWSALIAQPFTEQKLAGMILYQKYLLPTCAQTWRADLQRIAQLVRAGHIGWWNTADWLAMRVTGRMIGALENPRVTRALSTEILAWIDTEPLWLRRLGLVSFANHAKNIEHLFPGAQRCLLDGAARLVKSPERFHQTAVGWVIRELGKGDEKAAIAFVRANRNSFSAEGFRYATEKMSSKTVASLRKRA